MSSIQDVGHTYFTCTVVTKTAAHFMCGECEVWSFMKITLMEAQVQPKRYIIAQVKCLHYWLIATKLLSFVTRPWKVWGVSFLENSSNERRGTTEKILCSPRKVFLISDGSEQTNTVCSACLVVQGNDYTQKNTSTGSRDTVGSYVTLPVKCP
jgi:hypothetical protein